MLLAPTLTTAEDVAAAAAGGDVGEVVVVSLSQQQGPTELQPPCHALLLSVWHWLAVASRDAAAGTAAALPLLQDYTQAVKVLLLLWQQLAAAPLGAAAAAATSQ